MTSLDDRLLPVDDSHDEADAAHAGAEAIADRAAEQAPATDTRRIIDCPHCDHGSIIHRDGQGRETSRWRCHFCRGAWRILAPELCPMGCGRFTADVHGGPCAACVDELPGRPLLAGVNGGLTTTPKDGDPRVDQGVSFCAPSPDPSCADDCASSEGADPAAPARVNGHAPGRRSFDDRAVA